MKTWKRRITGFDIRRISVLSAIALFTISGVQPAYAYIDPGSTSIFLQILAAFGAAFVLTFRQTRTYLASLWWKLRGRKSKSD